MALLSETRSNARKGECKGAAYYRCFGNRNLSILLSRTQALVIKSGYELQRMIMERVDIIDDVDEYLERPHQGGVFVVPKNTIKKSKVVSFDGVEPDFMVFDERASHKCHIVELKDGCEFDTKASGAELDTVFRFIETNAKNFPYTFEGHICCFNETTREGIVKGFKNKITTKEALTGREFCEMLGIQYDDIVERRAKDRKANFEYFISEFVADAETINQLKELFTS